MLQNKLVYYIPFSRILNINNDKCSIIFPSQTRRELKQKEIRPCFPLDITSSMLRNPKIPVPFCFTLPKMHLYSNLKVGFSHSEEMNRRNIIWTYRPPKLSKTHFRYYLLFSRYKFPYEFPLENEIRIWSLFISILRVRKVDEMALPAWPHFIRNTIILHKLGRWCFVMFISFQSGGRRRVLQIVHGILQDRWDEETLAVMELVRQDSTFWKWMLPSG